MRSFTSESVSEGHPDKICDIISDAILDEYILNDPFSKVACETLITKNLVVIAGEIDSIAQIDVEEIVRNVLLEIGYTSEDIGINGYTCEIINKLHEQSQDIAIGVDKINDGIIGAGDQGMMFGYAENSNDFFMPMPIIIAHSLMKKASDLRKSGKFKWALPDMKAQVTL